MAGLFLKCDCKIHMVTCGTCGPGWLPSRSRRNINLSGGSDPCRPAVWVLKMQLQQRPDAAWCPRPPHLGSKVHVAPMQPVEESLAKKVCGSLVKQDHRPWNVLHGTKSYSLPLAWRLNAAKWTKLKLFRELLCPRQGQAAMFVSASAARRWTTAGTAKEFKQTKTALFFPPLSQRFKPLFIHFLHEIYYMT